MCILDARQGVICPVGGVRKNGPGRIASDERAGMDTPVWKEKGL